MAAAKTFFARINESWSGWMTEAQLMKGCKEFFLSNGYEQLEENTRSLIRENGSLTRFLRAPKPATKRKR